MTNRIARALLVASLAAAASAMLVGRRSGSATSHLTRLRGGQEGDSPDNRRLTKEEVQTKLNTIPVFCVLNEDGQFIGLSAEDGAIEVSFWIDLPEANEVLGLMKAASEESADGMRLGVLPLGVAFKTCGGWDNADPVAEAGQPRYVLRGPRQSAEEQGDTVREQLRTMGLVGCADSAWTVPVFCSDEFQRPDLMPLFFSEASLKEGWARSGQKPEDAELFIPTVMDLRALVVNMLNTDSMPWSRFQLVTSSEAYALAQQLQSEAEEDDEPGADEE